MLLQSDHRQNYYICHHQSGSDQSERTLQNQPIPSFNLTLHLQTLYTYLFDGSLCQIVHTSRPM